MTKEREPLRGRRQPLGDLTFWTGSLKIRPISIKTVPSRNLQSAKLMTPSHPAQPAKQKVSPEQCKHPQVQIVSRDEDSEYVECKECGEIFESSEFKDMEE
jgi:hypothetical protein